MQPHRLETNGPPTTAESPGWFGRRLPGAWRRLWKPLGAGSAAEHERADLVSLIFTVCTAIFLTKALLASIDLGDPRRPPFIYTGSWVTTLPRLAACCVEDVGAGLLCLLLALVALRCVRRPRMRRAIRAVVYVAALAALFLMVLDAHLFHQMRRFLTLALYEAAGGVNGDTGVKQYAASAAFKATAGLLPLLVLAIHLRARLLLGRFWRGAAGWLCRPALLVLLIACFFAGAEATRNTLCADGPDVFAQNPHLVLVRSFFGESSAATFAEAGAKEPSASLEDDFLPGRPQFSTGLPLVARPKNIVLITGESLAAAYMQVYGAPFPTTPNLCRLQKKGMVFTNFYATAGKTIASALPLFGSMYNDVTARVCTVVDREGFPVPAASIWLKGQGYRTYFLTSNGAEWDDYRNIHATFTRAGLFDVGRDDRHPFWKAEGQDPERIHSKDYRDEAMFADAKRVLRDARGHPFFLMMWNYDTHWPYYRRSCPAHFDENDFPESLGMYADRRGYFNNYLKSIWRLDAFIGDFYRELEELGLAEDTLVVLTGDHGEAWNQHGTWLHGESVHEEEVQVPLILLCPRLAPLGHRCDVIGSHVDLWPTLMDLCGLPADPRWQGRSLWGVKPGELRRAYFHSYGSTMLGVREGAFKFVLDVEHDRERLYDLAADPHELHDCAAEHSGRCDELRRRLQVWVRYQARLTRERIDQARAEKTPPPQP